MGTVSKEDISDNLSGLIEDAQLKMLNCIKSLV